MSEIDKLKEEVAKLQAFKDYVHQRLDEVGIDKEPNGQHGKHGCRIGDRLDIVLIDNHITVLNSASSKRVSESPIEHGDLHVVGQSGGEAVGRSLDNRSEEMKDCGCELHCRLEVNGVTSWFVGNNPPCKNNLD